MSFTFKIENDKTKEIIKKTHEAILDGLDAAGVQAVSIATVEIQKEPQRVDTGLLKNSIAYAVVGRVRTNLMSWSALMLSMRCTFTKERAG